MLKGCLIYDEVGAAKNGYIIERFCEEAKGHGLDLSLVIFRGVKSLPERVDFAVVRTRDPLVNGFFEKSGIRTFNGSRTNFVANDKYETYLLAKKLGLPVMETQTVDSAAASPFAFPFVVKSRGGHGGNEVYLCENVEEFRTIVGDRKDFIAQPFCGRVGVDVRLYCIGKTVVAAVKRSAEKGFKSNFTLGGRAEVFKPTDEQSAIVGKLYDRLKFDFVGVDFIMDGGKWVLNEIEDPVGSRMLYSCTDVDIAKVFIDYVAKEMKSE